MASEPAKVVELITGTLIDAYFEQSCLWDINTQIYPQSEFSFRTLQLSDSSAYMIQHSWSSYQLIMGTHKCSVIKSVIGVLLLQAVADYPIGLVGKSSLTS